jgi:hypothetical protein
VTTNTEVYTTDFYHWCLTTAALVRAGQWDDIDPEALAEELESLGKSQVHELENRLEELLLHLLKWEHQPERRRDSHSWADSILDQRNRIARLLRDNPSLRPKVATFVAQVYPTARERAIVAMAPQTPQHARMPQDIPALLRGSTLPLSCPWPEAQILDKAFWPPALSDLSGGQRHHS